MCTNGEGHEIRGQGQRYGKEHDAAAEFGAACKFVKKDQAQKDHDQHSPLGKGVCPVNMEKHKLY